ncbi:MAG: DNA polymerase ligase N-terminal domain-containing protein [Actinomycetota bacterium]|nr:DNA polymerase ligase N-terminal domain-containing protein [Actinomycetota bacterium]
MALEEYQEKRRFNKTSEPVGKPEEIWQKHFVVQEHYASHHHFDFRLELPSDFFESDEPSGPIVLKSWAVPKGISEEKGVKRLAVQVEDHPVSYIDFEGTIPEGQYGAGKVTIWDKGSFEIIQKKPKSFKFVLNGKRLKGEFHLVRTARGKGNEWLIFK